VLPIARKMAETYGVASMTAQRALRELQQRGQDGPAFAGPRARATAYGPARTPI
jgi:DNA-binding transcriptional MocR family regulator